METYVEKTREKLKDIKEKILNYKFVIKPTLILTIIYIIAISAILRANYNYVDDMGRVHNGNKGWDDFSRYTSNFLSTFIHADNYLTDVSPLPQIIACIILALSGVILLHIITNKKEFSIWELIATLPLGLSPYFLECISYKYDSPYMALSILASIFPLLFYKKGKIKYTIATILSILIVCTTYQAASGIFPMLVIFISMKQWNENNNIKNIIKFIIESIIGYVTALLTFELFIMDPIYTYASSNILLINEIIPGTIKNLIKYFTMIKDDFKAIWLIFVALICISYIFISVRDTKRKRYIAFPAAIITILLMTIIMFGMYPLLELPIFSPRAMYGFGVFIAIISTYIVTSKKAYLPKLVCMILIWMFFAFAFTYGNALYVEDKYTDYRITAVINDLDDLGIFETKNKKTVQIDGTIGLDPNIRKLPEHFPILSKLIPNTFNGNWYWGIYKFYYNYGLKNIRSNGDLNLKEKDLPILKESIYHTIKGNEEYILIELK